MAKRKSTQSNEERLQKKREAERRRYERMKQDPAGREQLKQKERDQYLKKKNKKTVRPINELTEREKRIKRKQWRKHSETYRNKKKLNQRLVERLRETTPPMSDEERTPRIQHTIRRSAGRRLSAKIRKARNRLLRKRNEQIRNLERKVEKYKKRWQRLKQKKEKTSGPPTPGTRVEEMLSTKEKKREVVKRLLFAEAFSDQLKENYKNLGSYKEKQVFKRVVSGKIVKKYRIMRNVRQIFRGGKVKESTEEGNILKYDRVSNRSTTLKKRNAIWKFLESDINSKMCPGKRDYCSKNKVIKQKRYLSNCLKQLHKKFLIMHPNIPVSYEFFTRNKPFWIVPRKISARDTCGCTPCVNMSLLVQSLFRLAVFDKRTVEGITEDFCCEMKHEKCLLRECKECKDKKMQYKDYDPSIRGFYFKWIIKKDTFYDKKSNKNKIVMKTIKEKIYGPLGDIVNEFENNITKYLQHRGTALYQYKQIALLKSHLQKNEVAVHMDFSENYSLKYSEETQAFHFGGSRQQISLHTVVVYYSNCNGKIKHQCFCTLSESLQHNVPAIWAHLRPILTYVGDTYGADTLHFISDSPATQYRNKTMFYFLAMKLKEIYPKLQSFSWNYFEAGHGKGAPDGVGGITKRTADRIVAEGNDIATSDDLIKCLQENVQKVRYFRISAEDIETISASIVNSEIKFFAGTMKVHQVKSTSVITNLHLRTLSSFGIDEHPEHFLGSLCYDSEKSDTLDESNDTSSIDSINIVSEKLDCIRVSYTDVYNSDEEKPSSSTVITDTELCPHNIKAGIYLLVALKTKKKAYNYAAVTQSDIDEDGEVKVMFLRLCDPNNGRAFRADENDISYVAFEQIISILPHPSITARNNKVQYIFPKNIDVYEQ